MGGRQRCVGGEGEVMWVGRGRCVGGEGEVCGWGGRGVWVARGR